MRYLFVKISFENTENLEKNVLSNCGKNKRIGHNVFKRTESIPKGERFHEPNMSKSIQHTLQRLLGNPERLLAIQKDDHNFPFLKPIEPTVEILPLSIYKS